jgi:hypothetical protein
MTFSESIDEHVRYDGGHSVLDFTSDEQGDVLCWLSQN